MSEVSLNQKKIESLNNLIESEGWRVLLDELQTDLDITEAKLFGEIKLSEGETHDSLQRERVDRRDLMKLPRNLIIELTEEEEEELDVEVYED